MMNSIIKKSAFALIASVSLLTACQSEPEVGDTLYPTDEVTYGPKAYINERKQMLNAAAFEVTQTPVALLTPTGTVSFYVKLTTPVDKDVTITVSEDVEAAANYDGDATALAPGSLNLKNATVTIPSGEVTSTEPIEAELIDSEGLHHFDGKAVAALKLTSVSDGVEIGKTNNAYYVIFNKRITNLKSQSADDLAELEKLATADYMPSVNGVNQPRLNDNNTSTYFYNTVVGVLEVLLTLNEETPIAALSYNFGGSTWYCPTVVDILTSNDGNTWESQTGGNVTIESRPNYNYIACPYVFYAPITCKYVKLRSIMCYYGERYGASYNRPMLSEVSLYK